MQNGRQNRSTLTLLAALKFLSPETQASFWPEKATKSRLNIPAE
jgi:hypothetical protein